ncbi:hypothetical protein GOA63_09240 [Sinorhizobium meliloti]|jgi:hypothetical protein|uniref:hypothetical protein n=1 Tax=Rhizobium meliloti TaxID=382 RepID=UPI001296E03F|nr:hypothetical protein [Sinorhizobium meliloti]MDW9592417.1 hypothetical protein [Sinorhizobium meliloti]MDX0187123.1 hypothetical protein [Sinorhizobium meliloti]MQV10507.1 hypothetical protein [Sinorhizobium meliloti]MQV61601.1 hypothetical protein [Sinorhizobium meliloti]
MKKPDCSREKFDDYVIDFALYTARAGKRLALFTLVRINGASLPGPRRPALPHTRHWPKSTRHARIFPSVIEGTTA